MKIDAIEATVIVLTKAQSRKLKGGTGNSQTSNSIFISEDIDAM